MIKILTERTYNNRISRQTVYEWEEDISTALGIPFKYANSWMERQAGRISKRTGIVKPISWIPLGNINIFFAMNIGLLKTITWYVPNVIPILLDVTLEEIDEVYQLTHKLPIFFVTALKIKEALLEKHPDCNVSYIPQTATDRYLKESQDKEYSIIQFGRRNPVLHEFATRYAETHQGVSYIYRCDDPAEGMEISENGLQRKLGPIKSREDFIHLLMKSKVCLCSTPLMDGTRDFGEGVDFLTARWYESIMCRCHIIARYSDVVIPELEQTGLIKLVDNVSVYEEFEKICGAYLNNEFPEERAVSFAKENSAAYRGRQILKKLHENGIK